MWFQHIKLTEKQQHLFHINAFHFEPQKLTQSSTLFRSTSASGERSPFFSGDLERLLESRPFGLGLRERLLSLSADFDRLRDLDLDLESFFVTGDLDLSLESRDLDLDLERLLLLDFDLLLDLDRERESRRRERDLERERLELLEPLERLLLDPPPRPLRPRSSTSRTRRPFKSVSSNLSRAAFMSE